MDRSPDGHLEMLVVASLAWRIEQAAISRRFEKPAPNIRRAIGTRIVRFGARLAGEPTYGLARSR